MKTSKTTVRLTAAIAGMALFLGAAAAAGVDRGKDMTGYGTLVSAPAQISAPDVVTAAGKPDAR